MLVEYNINMENKEQLEQDPVCKMVKPRDQFKFFMEYLGKKYYFCSENCRHMFSEMPRGYVGEEGK